MNHQPPSFPAIRLTDFGVEKLKPKDVTNIINNNNNLTDFGVEKPKPKDVINIMNKDNKKSDISPSEKAGSEAKTEESPSTKMRLENSTAAFKNDENRAPVQSVQVQDLSQVKPRAQVKPQAQVKAQSQVKPQTPVQARIKAPDAALLHRSNQTGQALNPRANAFRPSSASAKTTMATTTTTTATTMATTRGKLDLCKLFAGGKVSVEATRRTVFSHAPTLSYPQVFKQKKTLRPHLQNWPKTRA